MAIPSLPTFFDMVYSKSDGHLAPDGYLYNDQMFRALNALVVLVNSISTSSIDDKQMVTVNGINPPSKTTAEITTLQPNVNVGTIFYNSTLKKLQFKSDTGVIETITST